MCMFNVYATDYAPVDPIAPPCDIVPMFIGYVGENKARCVVFDLSECVGTFGEGGFAISFIRQGDEVPYLVTDTDRLDNNAIWIINNTDTAVDGYGMVQLQYIVGDVVCKTALYRTVTFASNGIPGDVPDPYEDLLAQIAAYAAQAEGAATTAKAAAETATNAVEAGITAERSQRIAADEGLQNQITALKGLAGAPSMAATAAAMTDSNKVYVYTGNEAGYTKGHWYYYSGAEWVDGGVYQATAVQTDPTLTVEGMAADAAACGDLKSQINVVASNQKTLFGAKWDRTTNLLTRTRDAADITTDTTNFCHKGTLNANYDNPFDNIYPWSEMVVCNVDLTKYRSGNYKLTDCIVAVYGDPDFTYYGSDTIFVGRYRPRFWYRSSEDSEGNVEFLVSQIERAGFRCAEEAIDGISFVVDDGSGNNTVTCGTNVPLTNVAVSQIHTRAKNSGFTLQDIYTLDQQIILYLVEYANMNSQQAIGSGCSSCYRENNADIISNVTVVDGKSVFDVGSAIGADKIFVGTEINFGTAKASATYKGIITAYELNDNVYTITLDRELAIADDMHCNVHGFVSCEFPLLGQSLGNASGYLGTDTKANAFYRGALLYANRYSYTLGIYRQTGAGHIWLCPDGLDPDDYDVLNTAVHKDTGVALPELSSAAWQTVGGNAQRIEDVAAFMITGASSGSSSSPVGDQQYVPLPSTGNTILLFGCNASNGWYCGVFSGGWHVDSGYSNWGHGGLPILKRTL